MATYFQYAPSGLLSRFIECYWTFRSLSTGFAVTEPLIPGGRIELIFNLANPLHFLQATDSTKGQPMTQAKIMGQRSHIHYAKQSKSSDINLLGVRFKPGGITAFTKIPVHALLNQVISAEDVVDQPVSSWINQLLDKDTDAEKIVLLNELLASAVKYSAGDWVICNQAIDIIRKDNVMSVRALCDESESYYKKLERSFLQCVGYTPKHYSRIVRFNKAIRLMKSSVNSLTSICHECDYYDQPHFIRDFRQFTGTTPGRFQRESHAIADFLIKHQVV